MSGRARQALAEGQSLAAGIQDVISEGIIGNAAYFSDFMKQRKHLTAVDPVFLMMYSTSIVIYRMARTQAWTRGDLEQFINDAGTELARAIRFHSTKETDIDRAASDLSQQLRATYHNVEGNLDRLVELLQEGDEKAVFTFAFMYLIKIYPGTSELLSERPSALGIIQPSFTRLTFKAAGLI